MRVIMMGTGPFAVPTLRELYASRHEVCALVTRPPRPVHGIHLLPGFADSTGKGIFRGENPPEGALLTFYLKSFTGEEAKITIKNAAGRPVAKFKLPGTPGLNRINWDLQPTKDLLTEYGGQGQKLVSAGEYTISLSYGEATSTQKIQVTVEPGVETR